MLKQLLGLLAAVGLVACVGITDPAVDRLHCLSPGDTVAYSVVSLGGVAILCDWTVKKSATTCIIGNVQRYSQTDCMEGEKWPRSH